MRPSNQGGRPRGAAGGKGSGERRKRTHFSPAEVAILVEAFAKDPYPGFEEREKLASRVQKLEPRVHVWFQNRRARQLRSTNVKVERNKGALLQNIQLWSQPRESPSHAAAAAAAAAAQDLVNEPSQPGRSWHLHHPLQHWGQYEQTSDLQQHQMVPFPQSSFGLGSAAKNVQPGFGGAGNLPFIQQQEQQNTFNQTTSPGNSYTDQSLQPSGNLQLGGQACTPYPRPQNLTHYSYCNQGGVNEENNYAHASLTGISPVLYSDEFQLDKKTSSFGDSWSHGSRSDMSLGYGSNMTTPSPSAQCQEGLQEQIPPSHVFNQPVTEYYPLWPAVGNDYLQELCKILANE